MRQGQVGVSPPAITRVVLVVLGGLVVVGASLGGLLAAMARTDDVAVADNESPTAVARWCDDLNEAFVPIGPFRSFRAVVEAAIDGRLRRPDGDPPLRDLVAYARWQHDHGEYLASSYLGLLESTPRPMVFTGAALGVVLTDAHAGRPVADPHQARTVARTLDRYRADRCR
jgi:hypothetical protein